MPESTTTETETVTIELEAELDEIHAPAWRHVLETSPDEATAKADLAELVQETADIDGCVYRLHREREQQQQQAAAQLFGEGVQIGQPAATDGGEGTDE